MINNQYILESTQNICYVDKNIYTKQKLPNSFSDTTFYSYLRIGEKRHYVDSLLSFVEIDGEHFMEMEFSTYYQFRFNSIKYGILFFYSASDHYIDNGDAIRFSYPLLIDLTNKTPIILYNKLHYKQLASFGDFNGDGNLDYAYLTPSKVLFSTIKNGSLVVDSTYYVGLEESDIFNNDGFAIKIDTNDIRWFGENETLFVPKPKCQ
jgi:hypothetical protein